MTVAASVTNGVLLRYSTDSGSTYTTISRRVKITPMERTRKAIETTDLDSTDETFLFGIRRSGTLSFTWNVDPTGTTDAALDTSYVNGTILTYKLTLVNATPSNFVFTAGIVSYAWGEVGIDNVMQATMKLKLTSSVTLNA